MSTKVISIFGPDRPVEGSCALVRFTIVLDGVRDGVLKYYVRSVEGPVYTTTDYCDAERVCNKLNDIIGA